LFFIDLPPKIENFQKLARELARTRWWRGHTIWNTPQRIQWSNSILPLFTRNVRRNKKREWDRNR